MVFGAALSAVAVIFSGFSASMEVGDGFHLTEGEGRAREPEEVSESRRDFPVRSQSRTEMDGTQDSLGVTTVSFPRVALTVCRSEKICPADCSVLYAPKGDWAWSSRTTVCAHTLTLIKELDSPMLK